ncbi:MAG: hypothetical protein HETSPECPRED_003253 [Heterodermia speciosa]|uniref:Aminoglycoside phosphotransferase domain-containing protein n=1 Tax=Heterodermia speciosa TaxID=116794 RepID=A0A8H3EBR9_9LECA|nr:MAG: hypothetical protein HETSPECPRED_003253 [Heterodermia speciosa]
MDSNKGPGSPANENENLDARSNRSNSSSIASVSGCSDHSDTSTLRYDQESWSIYRERVEQLCEELWPAQKTFKARLADSKLITRLRAVRVLRKILPPSQKPMIERMEGGDYNRITGITLPSSHKNKPRQLILRAPRAKELAHPERDVAVLKYIRQKSSIPVATVAAWDYSCNNPLESPYVLQNRVEGQDLDKLWPTLTHAQRRTVAIEVGGAIRKLLSLETNTPGLLGLLARDGTPHAVDPFELKDCLGEIFDEPEYTLPERQTTSEFLTAQFHRWRAVDLERSAGEVSNDIKLWDRLLETVREMNDVNLFPPDLGNCLCHVDLHPRNIMVAIQPDKTLKVTAILDWDEAVFAPKFVNCIPPLFLWRDDGEDRVDENGIDPWPYELGGADDPVSEQRRELKRLFEEAAGPDYRALAYEERFRLGRVLFRLATTGLVSSQNTRAAEKVLTDWYRRVHRDGVKS